MNISEFIEVYENYRQLYLDSDINMEVKFGCDCGCGGDYYTTEQWENMINAANEAKNNLIAFCIKNNIDYSSL